MDPLSIIASIIAILSTGGVIANGLGKIRSLKDAPAILLQLHNEVSDLNVLVRAVDDLYRRPGPTHASRADETLVCSALERGRDAILELEKLIEYTLTKETRLGSQVNRTAWIGSLSKLKETRITLRAARDELTKVWAVLSNRHVSSHIEVELREVCLAIGNLQSASEDNRAMLDRSMSLAAAQEQLLGALQEELRGSRRSMTILERQYPSDKPPEVSATQNAESREIRTEDPYRSTIALHLAGHCEEACQCSCHRRTCYNSLAFLSHVFGVLFIGYSGIPRISTFYGSRSSCCKHAGFKGSIVYIFPLWLAALAFTAEMKYSHGKGPQMLLRCVQVRPYGSTPFQASASSRWDRVRTLVETGKASSLDVSETGTSLLSYAMVVFPVIIKRDPDVVERYFSCIDFLLYEGADVHQEDIYMLSPYRRIWRYCLLNKGWIDTHPSLYRLLNQGDPVEAFGFSTLHRAILNLDPSISFKAKLALIPREAINETDYTGRTALSWAADLGNYDGITRLLIKGADPNITDFAGKSPLFWCIADINCMTALLDAGAQVDQISKVSLWTKMAALIKDSDDIKYPELLCQYGASLKRAHGSDRDVIHYAVGYYRPNILEWLLKKNVDLEARTELGETPLLHFLSCDNGEHPDILEMLLDKDLDCHATDYFGEGLCHYMARWSSLAFLHIISHHRTNLAELDVNRRSCCGLARFENSISGTTAMELAAWRRDFQSDWSFDNQMDPDPDPQAWFAAFEAWIEGIKAQKKTSAHHIDEANDERAHRDGQGVNLESKLGVEEEMLQSVPGKYPDD